MDSFSLDKIRSFFPFPSSTTEADPSSLSSANMTDDMASPDDFDPAPSEEDATSIIEPRPITPDNGLPPPKSNLDLINDCDTFPYLHTDPALYLSHINTYYHLRIAAHPTTTLGYVLPSVAEVLRGLPSWSLNDDERTLTLTTGETEAERSAAVAATTQAMRATGHFHVLKGWRNELYPVYGPAPDKALLFSIERAASPLFGVVSYGVHCTAYTYIDEEEEEKEDDESESESKVAAAAAAADASQAEKPVPISTEANTTSEEEEEKTTTTTTTERKQVTKKKKVLKLWIPRRSAHKSTYPSLLDNTIAGGLATTETPLYCLVRESAEEASLPSSLVTAAARPAGCVTYFHIRDGRAGGETGLLQPECQYVYDLPLPADVVPKPGDDEVEQFFLMGVQEVRSRLRAGEFKPNCAVVLLDWFVRHGVLTPEDEGDFVEIVARLHRRLEFPTI